MRKLSISSKGIIKIANIGYKIIEVNKDTLSKRQAEDVYGNKILNTAGVYIFISDKDFPNFNINYFNSEVTGVFVSQYQPIIRTMEVPPFNEKPKKGCLFYVGRDTHVISRIKEHWKTAKLNGCTSLKLGFASRKWIKKFLKVYAITSCADKSKSLDYKQLEKDIRNEYGATFGK